MSEKRFGHKVLSVLACSSLAVLLMAVPAIAVGQASPRDAEGGRDRAGAAQRGGGRGNPDENNAGRRDGEPRGGNPGGGNPGGGNPGGGNPGGGNPGGGNPGGGNPGGGNPGGGNPGGGNPGGGNPGGGNPGGGNPGGGGGGGGNPGGGGGGGGKPGGGKPGGGKPGGGNARGRPKVTVCHATGSAKSPYVVNSISQAALSAHLAHGDIYPVPVTGCPGAGDPGGNPDDRGKVTICHATGSAKSPYVVNSVSEAALPAHLAHGDIYPVPATGCPGAGGGTNSVTVCHFTGVAAAPYVERVISVTALNTHLLHGDIYPVPVGGCPDADVDEGGNVTVCHFTGVAAAPFVEQVIPIAELGTHLLHGDIYPVPVGGCPDVDVDEEPGFVTVCHFTGVATAPYVEQVIPIAELGSHLLHGDLYPVPVGGCPAVDVDEEPGYVTVCHFTGVAAAPYVEQVIPIAELGTHLLHGDLYPVRVAGCYSVLGEIDYAEPGDGPPDGDEDDPVAGVGQPRQRRGINASVEPGAQVAVTGASVLSFLLFSLGLIGSGVATLWRSRHHRKGVADRPEAERPLRS